MAQQPIPGLTPYPYLANLSSTIADADAQREAGLRALSPEFDPNAAQPLGVDTSQALAPGSQAGTLSKAFEEGKNELAGGYRAVKGLAQMALGNEADARPNLEAFQEYQHANEVGGNKVQSLGDVHDIGSGIDYATDLVGRQIPSLPLLIGTGGIGGAVGKGLARLGVETAAKDVLETGVGAAAKKAAVTSLEHAGKVAGEAVGATVGGTPLTAPAAVAAVTDPNAEGTPEEKATKALIGAASAAAVGALPITRALERFGGASAVGAPIASEARRLLPGVVKEAGTQALVQGAAGAAQQAVALATHKWVNDNVDLGDGAAMQQYLEGLAGGAVGGALLGGTIGGVNELAGVPGRARGVVDGVSTLGGKARDLHAAIRERFGTDREPVPVDEGAQGDGPGPLASALGDLASAAGDRLTDVVGKVNDALSGDKFKASNDELRTTIATLAEKAKTASEEMKPKIVDAIRKATQRLRPDEEITMESTPEGADFANAHDTKAETDFNDAIAHVEKQSRAENEVELPRAPNQNPVQFGNGLQNVLATHIPTDAPQWAFHGKVLQPMMDAVERVFRNDYGDDAAGVAARKRDGREFASYLALIPSTEARRTVQLQAARFGDAERNVRIADKHVEEPAPEHDEALHQFEAPIDETQNASQEDVGSDTATGHETNTGVAERIVGDATDSEAVAQLRAPDLARDGFVKAERPDFEQRGRELGNSAVHAVDAEGGAGKLNLNFLTSERLKLAKRGEYGDVGTRAAKIAAFRDGLADAYLHGYKVAPGELKRGSVFFRSRDGKTIEKLSAREAGDVKEMLKSKPSDIAERTPYKFSTDKERDIAATRESRGLPRESENPFNGRPRSEVADKVAEGTIVTPGGATRPEQAANQAAARLPKNIPPRSMDLLSSVNEPADRNFTSARFNPKGAIENARAVSEQRVARNAVVRATEDVRAALPKELHGKLDVLIDAYNGKENRAAAQATASGREILRGEIKRGQGSVTAKAAAIAKITDEQAKVRGLDEFSRRLMNQAPKLRSRMDAALKVAETKDPQFAETLRKVGKDSLVQTAQSLRDSGQLSEAAYAKRIDNINAHPEMQLREGQRVDQRPIDTRGVEVTHGARDNETINQRAAAKEVGEENIAKADDEISTGFNEVKRESKHDLPKEERMVNAILKALGIKGIKVKHIDEFSGETNSGKKPSSGVYEPGSGTIYLADNLHGAERAEVIFHEVGHHIYRNEFESAPPVVKAAIEADFQNWRADRTASKGETVADILASKKGAARAGGILRRADGTTPDLLTDKARSYLYDREEYIADQISRALASNGEAQTVVGRFFVTVADKLKAIYEKVFGNPKYAQYKPAPSVEAWVQSMFDRTTLGAAKAMDRPVSAGQAKIVAAAALRAAHGETDGSGKVEHGEATGRASEAGAAEPAANADGGAGSGGDGGATGGGGSGGSGAGAVPNRSLADFFAHVVTPQDRVILERALSRRGTENKIRAASDEGTRDALSRPESRLSTLLARGYEEWSKGTFKVGPQTEEVFGRVAASFRKAIGYLGNDEYAQRIFEDIQNGRIERLHAAGKEYDSRGAATRGAGRVQEIKHAAETVIEKSLTPATTAFLRSMGDRMRQSGIPAMGELVARIERGVGEHGEAGFNVRQNRKYNEFQRRFGEAIDGLSPRATAHVLRRMQRQDFSPSKNGKVNGAVTKLQDVFARALTYAKETLPIGERENFMPIVMDSEKVNKNEAAFRDFMSQPKFDGAIREKFAKLAERAGDKDRAAEIRAGKVPQDDLITRLFRAAARPEEVGEGEPHSSTPGFQSERARLMQFVYEHGDEADKRQFAKWQSGDLHGILGSYAKGLTRRTEYARQFGADGSRFEEMLARAKREGATDEHVQLMRDYAAMNTGSYGSNFSPTFKKVFTKIDKVFGTKLVENITDKSGKGKAAIAALAAYENMRVLPLAVLSSLTDPLGIFVRSGGEVGSSFKAVKEGLRQMAKGGDLVKLGNMLGLLDEHLIQDALSATYGSSVGGKIGKVNNFIFKWNGLAGLTKATRVMALSSAQTFLLKHAELAKSGNEKSATYLKELGIKPDDVLESDPGRVKVMTDSERDNASSEDVARDERVRDALTRFVDESILRPTAAQRPGWHSDPYFSLVSQYKGYLYAFHDKIIKRAMQEVGNGNPRVLLPLLAYVPVSLTAEILREFANYGPQGSPNRKDWGPGDYLALAYQKSGLLGPGVSYAEGVHSDKQYQRMLGSSFLGPTAQQAGDVGATIAGNKPIGSTLEESLPAGSVLQHYL